MKVGERIQWSSYKGELSDGIIAYIGSTHFTPGDEMLGIKLDKPLGKNNGSVEGVRYFNCNNKHGIFIKSDSRNVKLLKSNSILSNTNINNNDISKQISNSNSMKNPLNNGNENNNYSLHVPKTQVFIFQKKDNSWNNGGHGTISLYLYQPPKEYNIDKQIRIMLTLNTSLQFKEGQPHTNSKLLYR